MMSLCKLFHMTPLCLLHHSLPFSTSLFLCVSVWLQGDSWPSLTARQPLKLAATTRVGPSRVRFQGSTTTASRCWNWQQKMIPACRWRGTFDWSGTRCPCWPPTPPPPPHWRCPICPPQSWKPPPLWPPPPPAGSAHPAWGRASQRSERVWRKIRRELDANLSAVGGELVYNLDDVVVNTFPGG